MNLDWHADRSDLPELATLDQLAVEEPIDLAAVRSYRLGRVREQMEAHALDACILLDPVNIRYATGARNMQVFHARNPARYLFVPQSGPVVLYEFAGCAHLAEGLETIDEIRPAITASYAAAGTAIQAVEQAWARQVAGLVREHCGPRAAVGVERANAGAALALREEGFHLSDAQAPVERARAVKSTEELKCVRASVRATEVAVARLRAAMRPGLSENELWSVLHQGVIALGGDYVETRLLSSGAADQSLVPGDRRPTPRGERARRARHRRRRLPRLLLRLLTHLPHRARRPDARATRAVSGRPRAGAPQHGSSCVPARRSASTRERAWKIPERFVANRYFVSAHGCGMTGEYPYLYHAMDFDESGYDGVVEPGMTLCVESYIGEEGGREGVKLEQQLLITEDGQELLSTFPFEPALLDQPA